MDGVIVQGRTLHLWVYQPAGPAEIWNDAFQRLRGVTKGKMVSGNKRAKLKPRIEVAPKRKVVRDTSGIKQANRDELFRACKKLNRQTTLVTVERLCR